MTVVAVTIAARAEGPATTSREQQLRNYALAWCVSRSFSDPKVVRDAQQVAGAYIQFKVQLSEAEKIQELVMPVLKSRYATFNNEELRLMRCMDFSNGERVGAVISGH